MSCTQDSGFTGPAVILDEGLGIMSQGYEGPLKMGGLWTRLTGGREGESRTERGGSEARWEAKQRRSSPRAE